MGSLLVQHKGDSSAIFVACSQLENNAVANVTNSVQNHGASETAPHI